MARETKVNLIQDFFDFIDSCLQISLSCQFVVQRPTDSDLHLAPGEGETAKLNVAFVLVTKKSNSCIFFLEKLCTDFFKSVSLI